MPTTLTESGALTAGSTAGGNMLIQLITPGTGSSGTYSADVLETAATDKVFKAGTLMFADHPGEGERYDRPERSIRDVAGVLVEDARWDGGALVAEARTFAPWTDVLKEMHDAIGVSIRASADVDEARGGPPAVKRLVEGVSVDFVTKAGRGGAIRQVYESARDTTAVLVRDTTDPTGVPRLLVTEATANDTREALQAAVRASHGSDDSYAWVRDFDDSTVYFDLDSNDEVATYQQTYTLDDGTAALTGDAVQVRARTEYVPLTSPSQEADPAPAGQSQATESQGDTMATTQIEESRLAQLEKDSERVQTAESERDQLRTQLAERDRADQIRATLAEADSDGVLTHLERRGLAADAPVKDDGTVDTAALTESANAAIAEAKQRAGHGSITGFGATPTNPGEVTEAAAKNRADAAFGRTVKEA